MKIICTNVITSTDKKVLTPFVKGSVYDSEPLIIKGKAIRMNGLLMALSDRTSTILDGLPLQAGMLECLSLELQPLTR